MQEKDMVNDVLSMINSSITGYGSVITQANDQQFRQTVQQVRNNCEMFQYNLYKVAEQKGYYKPASQADQSEVNQIKSEFSR
jgi:spore coat protein CotF